MIITMNEVRLIGNLGKDIELRRLQNGSVTASFSLATRYNYKDQNGNYQEHTEWHQCVVWGKTAEAMAKRVGKGSRVYIEGRLTHRAHWEYDKVTISEVRVVNWGPFDDQQTRPYDTPRQSPPQAAQAGTGSDQMVDNLNRDEADDIFPDDAKEFI